MASFKHLTSLTKALATMTFPSRPCLQHATRKTFFTYVNEPSMPIPNKEPCWLKTADEAIEQAELDSGNRLSFIPCRLRKRRVTSRFLGRINQMLDYHSISTSKADPLMSIFFLWMLSIWWHKSTQITVLSLLFMKWILFKKDRPLDWFVLLNKKRVIGETK